MIHLKLNISESHEKRNRWKSAGVWTALGMFTLAFLSDIVWVTWTVAATSSKVELTSASWEQMNTFRIETIKGNVTQKEINAQLMSQLSQLKYDDSVKYSTLKYRVDRLDKTHGLQDPSWDNIRVN
jgi:hypothetical protein